MERHKLERFSSGEKKEHFIRGSHPESVAALTELNRIEDVRVSFPYNPLKTLFNVRRSPESRLQYADRRNDVKTRALMCKVTFSNEIKTENLFCDSKFCSRYNLSSRSELSRTMTRAKVQLKEQYLTFKVKDFLAAQGSTT